MKLKFLNSPTGAFGLGYHTGQTANIENKELAAKLIEKGYAISVDQEDKSEAAAKKASTK